MRGRAASFVPRTCAAAGCEQMARCRGFCSSHYMRWWRHGDPLAGGPSHHPADEWSASPTYAVWSNMRQRCDNPNNSAFANYGARGIAVCARWATFENFLADMGHPPSGMTLEREDNHGPYSPENCRWATPVEQGQNKRNNRLLTIDGETLTISAWGRRYGLAVGTIHHRLETGWPDRAAVTCPAKWNRVGVPRGTPRHAIPFTPLSPVEERRP